MKSMSRFAMVLAAPVVLSSMELSARLDAPSAESPLVFNFGPPGSGVPSGVIETSDLAFDPARGFGWLQAPDALRKRNRHPDPLRDTLAGVTVASKKPAEFAVALPDGDYVAELVIGDPQHDATARVFLGNNPDPVGSGRRVPSGLFWVERRAVKVENGRLALRVEPPPSAEDPISSLALLRIFPAGTTLEVAEGDRFPEKRPVRPQNEIAETPVDHVAGQMVALDTLARPTSSEVLISDAGRPGMWCWFQDPRVIIDTKSPGGPVLLAGVVTFGPRGSEQRGDIDLYWLRLDTRNDYQPERGRIELEDRLQMDDHCSPGLMIRPDGRYLATWSMHGETGSERFPNGSGESAFLRWRISKNPGDPTEWGPMERNALAGRSLCYTHPMVLSKGRNGHPITFNAVRAIGFDSNLIWSQDFGQSWSYGGRLIDTPDPWPDHPNGGRGYVKYAGDGVSRVYILSTDDHPGINFNDDRTDRGPYLNSVYAGYIEDNKLHDMEGRVVDANVSDPIGTPANNLTVLLKDGTRVGDAAMRRGWLNDLRVMHDGHPVAIIQFRADDDQHRHRYFYLRHDGQRYHVHFLAHAGSNFGGASEPDYAGLATVDPMNPETVYISTSAHPVTGEELVSSATGKRQFEIFMGRTSDGGRTWDWAPLTENSSADNIRPFAPAWEKGRSAVVWMRGNYPSFYVYDTKVLLRTFDLPPLAGRRTAISTPSATP